MRHEWFSFYGPRKSDEGADTDLINNFCWPKSLFELPHIDIFGVHLWLDITEPRVQDLEVVIPHQQFWKIPTEIDGRQFSQKCNFG